MVKKRVIRKYSPPTGVKVISIIYYIIAISLLLTSLIVILVGFIPIAGLKEPDLFAITTSIMAIPLIALASFIFFIGIKLWKGSNGVRIFIIISSVTASISSLASIFSVFTKYGGYLVESEMTALLNRYVLGFYVPFLLINATIAVYLLFNKRAKDYFNIKTQKA